MFRKRLSSVGIVIFIPILSYKLIDILTIMGGIGMTDTLSGRVIETARYIVETRCTVRQAAKHLGVSKSTVHKDMTCRLKEMDGLLYDEVESIMQFNKSERHIRGGLATKKKYEQIKNKTA